MKNKKLCLERLFLIKLLVRAFFSLCYLLFILAILIHFPLLERFSNRHVTSFEEIETAYNEGCSNVKIEMKKLKYTGYDYYEDGKPKGAFYYSFINDKCVFFLLSADNKENELRNYTVKAKMEKGNISLDYVINQMTSDTGIAYEDLNVISSNILLNEIDYPIVKNVGGYSVIMASVLVALFGIGSSFVYAFYPIVNPDCRQLDKYGGRMEIMEEVNSQIYNYTIIKDKRYILTKEFLIIRERTDVAVIKNEMIMYISKHAEVSKLGIFKKKMKYKLTMSSPQLSIHDYKFYNEEEVDQLISEIIKVCPNIDTSILEV